MSLQTSEVSRDFGSLTTVRWLLAALGVVVLVTAVLVSPVLAGPAGQAPTEKPSAARGQRTYAENCVACHGQSGLGDGPTARSMDLQPAKFSAESYARDNSPGTLFDIITNGRMDRFMPPWKERLTAAEVWDVLFYTWWLGTPPERLSRGAEVYEASCAGCHGQEGRGDGPDAASLAARPPDFTDLVFVAARSQQDLFDAAGAVSEHPGWADLPEDDRWAALDFVRVFSYEPAGVIEETFDGAITGQVLNGTADAVHPDLSGVVVTLYPFVNQSLQTPITTTTGVDASFTFEGLGTGVNREYDLSARYQGIEYFAPVGTGASVGHTGGGDLLRFTEPGQVLTAMVTVYETTTEPDAVVLDRTHLILDFASNDTLDVGELHIFQNLGDRTFVGAPVAESSGEPVTLRFELPSDATNLRFEDPRMESTIIRTEDGFLDTRPVLPGARQVLFSYQVPYRPPSFRFSRLVAYDSNNLNVLVRDTGLKVTVPGLTEGPSRDATSGIRYLNFGAQDVSQGQELVVEFEGTPQLAAPSTSAEAEVTPPAGGLSGDLLRWAAVVLAAVAGAAAIGYAVMRGRPAAPAEAEPEDDLEELRRELLLALAHLDDAYEAGEMQEADYREERALTKAQLIAVMRRLRSEGG